MQSFESLDWCCSGGSMGGAHGAWAPLIFRPKWGLKGRKNVFDLKVLSEGLDLPLCFIIYNLHSMQGKLCLIAYRGSWFCSWSREFFWILNLPPNRRVNFLGGFKLQKNCNQSCSSKKFFGLVEMTFGLVDGIVFLGTLLHMYRSIGRMLCQSVVKSSWLQRRGS